MVYFEYYFLKNLVKSILLNLDKDQSKKNEGEKTEGHDNDENMENDFSFLGETDLSTPDIILRWLDSRDL